VKIIDATDPAHPHQIATAAGYANTSAEHMQVMNVHTAAFRGDLLGVGLQNCGLGGQAPGKAGLDLWNVTDRRTLLTWGSSTPATCRTVSTSSP